MATTRTNFTKPQTGGTAPNAFAARSEVTDDGSVGVTTTRFNRGQRQAAQPQPLAKIERQEGIKGNFGALGNFFNLDD